MGMYSQFEGDVNKTEKGEIELDSPSNMKKDKENKNKNKKRDKKNKMDLTSIMFQPYVLS